MHQLAECTLACCLLLETSQACHLAHPTHATTLPFRLRSLQSTTQEFGVNMGDLKKLREGGVHTIESLAHASKKELCQIKGISEAKVRRAVGAGFWECMDGSGAGTVWAGV